MLNWDDGADADGGSGGWRRTAAAMVTTVSMVKVHSRNNGEATPSSQLKPRVPPSLLTSSAMRWLKLAEFADPPLSPPPRQGSGVRPSSTSTSPKKIANKRCSLVKVAPQPILPNVQHHLEEVCCIRSVLACHQLRALLPQTKSSRQ